MELKNIPIVGRLLKVSEVNNVDFGFFSLVIGFLIFIIALNVADIRLPQVITFLFAMAPLWLPVLTFLTFYHIWMNMVGQSFYLYNGRTTYEIKLPQEVFKSPEAMEYVFNQIYNAQSPDNLMETYLQGKRPLTHSFELVSHGGDVRFYVNVPTRKSSEAFVTNMYAQYPNIEIVELELDYTAQLPHDLRDISLMSFHFCKKEDQEFPIKTYIDFGLDQLPKEEEKNDPITPLLEVLASIKPHQQVWLQFVCTAHRKQSLKNGQLLLNDKPTWEKGVQAKIDGIMKRDSKTKSGPVDVEGMPRLTPGERSTVEAMERNMGKFPYEFACRWLYISHKPNDYDGSLYYRMIRALAAWDARGRNGLGMTWRTDYNYKFISDPFHVKIPALKKQELKEYKLRKFFPKDANTKIKVMSAEEMASIYHLPGKVALTPTLNRVPSTRGEAPSNLPVGEFTP